MKRRTQEIYDEFSLRYPRLSILHNEIIQCMDAMISCYHEGGKIVICGNGGSAADSEHMVGELMKGFQLQRPVALNLRTQLTAAFSEEGEFIADHLQTPIPSLSLVTHTALLTALCNDNEPDLIFAQQVYGYCQPHDIFVAFSTSGNSKNVVYAAMLAKTIGTKIIVFTGESGGRLAELAAIAIKVPEQKTFKIQELHLPVYHVLCLLVESEMFEK